MPPKYDTFDTYNFGFLFVLWHILLDLMYVYYVLQETRIQHRFLKFRSAGLFLRSYELIYKS